jgi:putative component of toxin-antitoxin plasmid stabilization module
MTRKPLEFVGKARQELQAFPKGAKERMGYQLDELQQGNTPDDFKPMKTIGPGVYELRVRAEGQAWRVFYVARFEEPSTCCTASRRSRKRRRRRKTSPPAGRATPSFSAVVPSGRFWRSFLAVAFDCPNYGTA